MSDFAFLNRDPIDRIAQRRQHMEDIRRDAFKRKIKLIGDDCEEAQEHCRALIRAGSDVSEEIDELLTTARAVLLVALILKREQVK